VGRYPHRSLQLCLNQSAQKTFLGGVRSAEFPQCGLECSHLPLAYREITQVNQQGDRLVEFVGLPIFGCALQSDSKSLPRASPVDPDSESG